MLYWVTIHCFSAPMLLVFTMRRMVRSAHLTLSPRRFTALFDFAASNRYSYEKIGLHTASLVRRDGTQHSVPHQVVTCVQISPSRLPNDALCIY